MRFLTSTARESRRHHRDIRRYYLPIKNLGESGFYLRCYITRDRDAGTMKLDKQRYMRITASKLDLEKTQHHAGSSGSKPLSNNDAPQTEAGTEGMRVTPYREAVGAIMLAATMTRPDVAYATHQLGNFNDNPGPVH